MYKIYTTKYLNAISFICSVIIFILICFINEQIINNKFSFSSIFQIGNQDTIKVQFDSIENTNIKEENKEQEISKEEKELDNLEEEWSLNIPRIFLEAKIQEGTEAETMNVYIGHFEETSRTTGNIGLAGHNRGYPVNYFENLKLLKKGDIIKYQYKQFIKEYVVTENIIIQDTNWEYLKETEENRITLITCVENEPEYRRCVRGIEKSK